MKRRLALAVLAGWILVAAYGALAGAVPIGVRYSPELGHFLVGEGEMTLYLFTPDQPGVSTCYEACARIWPPLIVSYGEPTLESGIDGELGWITRGDGARQVTYNGMPLYGWINDQQPGDATGHVSCKASMDPTRGSPHVSPRIAAQLVQDFHSFGVRQLYQKRRTRKIDAPLNRLENTAPHSVLGSPFGPSMKPVNRLAHALFRTLIKDVDDSKEVVQHV